jgi:two-component system nitrogen regulation sensor histidine kinase GlnL
MDGYRFVVDKNLVIVSWDTKVVCFLGASAEMCLGVPYYDVVPRIVQGDADVVESVLRDGNPRLIKDYRSLCIFGSAHGDIAVSPVYDTDHTVMGAEVMVEAFSHCTAVASRRAVPDNLEIDRKSVTLAHGVRSPLNAIKGAAVYLRGKYRTDPGLVEFMDIIEDEISKLDRFVTKFISTSLVESEFDLVDIAAMLRKALALVSLQATVKRIVIRSEFPELPLIRADEYLLEHAVLNVINNAVEALDDGGTIKMSAEMVRQEDQDFVAIEIADDGYGMNRSRLRAISSGSPERRTASGRGFGLFITREVAQYHGGHLEIESSRNSGTRVRILLPVALPET